MIPNNLESWIRSDYPLDKKPLNKIGFLEGRIVSVINLFSNITCVVLIGARAINILFKDILYTLKSIHLCVIHRELKFISFSNQLKNSFESALVIIITFPIFTVFICSDLLGIIKPAIGRKIRWFKLYLISKIENKKNDSLVNVDQLRAQHLATLDLENEDYQDKDKIKKAYRNLSLRYHPDKTNNDLEKTEIFKQIDEAYKFLIQE